MCFTFLIVIQFLVDVTGEFGVIVTYYLLADKHVYSPYLFARLKFWNDKEKL